jgi:hypothetical protein
MPHGARDDSEMIWYLPLYLYAQGHPVFALAERKNETSREVKYRLAVKTSSRFISDDALVQASPRPCYTSIPYSKHSQPTQP